MKKLISILLTTLTLCTSFSVAFAKVGDVIGYAIYTDIVAYINNYPIMSYNVNDYTVVVAEDLRNYGFDVEWNEKTRSLHISKGDATTITPYGTIYSYASKKGQKSMPYLETDIKTYINGTEIDSYNINGSTVVNMEDLTPFGEVIWIPEARALKMRIEGLPHGTYKIPDDINTTEKTQNRTPVIVETNKITSTEISEYYKWFKLGLDFCTQAIKCLTSYTKYGDSSFISLFTRAINGAVDSFEHAYHIAVKYDNTSIIAEKTSQIISLLNSMNASGVTRTDINNYADKFQTIITLSKNVLTTLDAIS